MYANISMWSLKNNGYAYLCLFMLIYDISWFNGYAELTEHVYWRKTIDQRRSIIHSHTCLDLFISNSVSSCPRATRRHLCPAKHVQLESGTKASSKFNSTCHRSNSLKFHKFTIIVHHGFGLAHQEDHPQRDTHSSHMFFKGQRGLHLRVYNCPLIAPQAQQPCHKSVQAFKCIIIMIFV